MSIEVRRKEDVMRTLVAALVLLVAAATVAGDLADEPILYSNMKGSFTVLTRERLLPLHKALASMVGPRVQFRVTPYFGEGNAIKAELIDVYYQEKSADLAVIRGNVNRVLDTVFKTLGRQLNKDSGVTVYARLPEGKVIRDFKVETNPNCLDKNAVMEHVNTANYAPGPPADRLAFLCNIPGAQDLDARFVRKDMPLQAEMWRVQAEVKP
jgi:hypothetical protein